MDNLFIGGPLKTRTMIYKNISEVMSLSGIKVSPMDVDAFLSNLNNPESLEAIMISMVEALATKAK